MPTQSDIGCLVELLVGEGHFGGDGRRAQVTLRMHVRHEGISGGWSGPFPVDASMARITTAGETTFSGWLVALTSTTSSCRSSTDGSRLISTAIASTGSS
jgi:hypothetical protein